MTGEALVAGMKVASAERNTEVFGPKEAGLRITVGRSARSK
jgi:hypothetical protein